MERASLIFCVCVGAYFATVLGQVATLCRANERFLTCGGCQKSCAEPAPACAAVCRTGCYCEPDQVRNSTGHCVPLSECPTIPAYKLQTSEPRVDCPPNEEYRFCEPCNRTCEEPNPVCPAQCARGCFCRGDLLRHSNGTCVEYGECPKAVRKESSNFILPFINKKKACGPHQVFKDCETCEKTCSEPNPVCPAQCLRGCFCEDGLVKAPSGKCIKLDECSKDGIQPIPYRIVCGPRQVFKRCACQKTCSNPDPMCASCRNGCFCEEGLVKAPSGDCVKLDQCPKAEMTIGAMDPSVEDCAPDEEFLSCGWCEPSCWQPAPACAGACARGCLCRPPLVRHYSGHCVERAHCEPQKCKNPNEEFVCRYGCEARCGGRACARRPRRCRLGCHCRLGLLRDAHTGRCVAAEECPKTQSPDDELEERVHRSAVAAPTTFEVQTVHIRRNLQNPESAVTAM